MGKLLIACSAALLAMAPAAEAQTPAAMIIKVSGDVTVRLGGADPVTAAAPTPLGIGDQVIASAGAVAVVVHATGRKQTITEPFTLAEATGGTQAGTFATAAGILANAARSDARSAPNRQGMIRPLPGEPVLISPRNGVQVMGTRPTFTWFSVDGATGYTIQIRRDGGPPIRLDASDTTFTLPASAPALVPGETYFWTVAPSGAGRPTREQSFRVIGSEGYGAVQEALDTLVENELDPFGDGLFMAATIYRDAELYYEAAAALSFLESTGSPLSAQGWLLRADIYDALGMLDEAAAAFDHADKLMR